MAQVAIIGDGNIGHALAALVGSRPDLEVSIWGRNIQAPARWTVVAGAPGRVYASGIVQAETSLARALKNADAVITTLPTHLRGAFLARAARWIKPSALVLAWEGSGWFLQELRAAGLQGALAAGLQRSPIVCRMRSFGREVELFGMRTQVVAAAAAPAHRAQVGRLLQALFPFKTVMAPDYDCVSLSPGNPLIHPARLYATRLAVDPDHTRFYGDWNDAASGLLLTLHRELANVRDALGLPKKYLKTLVDGRHRMTAAELTGIIAGEERLAEVRMPLRETAKGLVLDRRHRFFQEDIGHGLAHLVARAKAAGVDVPAATAICAWYATGRP